MTRPGRGGDAHGHAAAGGEEGKTEVAAYGRVSLELHGCGSPTRPYRTAAGQWAVAALLEEEEGTEKKNIICKNFNKSQKTNTYVP
jgi:hypothetical protein